MSTYKYLNDSDTLYLLTKLKNALDAGWVAKDGNKVLSDENFTSALKSKLDGIQASATATSWSQTQTSTGGTKIAAITINGTSTDVYTPTVSWSQIQTSSGGTKIATISIAGTTTDIYAPAGSSITVDSAMSDSSTNPVQNKVIKKYVDDAVGAVVGVEFRKVNSLPAQGENGVIYLLPKSGTPPTGNIYEEWIWISSDNDYEKIGETSIDLSGYVQSSELVAITTAEIDTIFATIFGS